MPPGSLGSADVALLALQCLIVRRLSRPCCTRFRSSSWPTTPQSSKAPTSTSREIWRRVSRSNSGVGLFVADLPNSWPLTGAAESFLLPVIRSLNSGHAVDDGQAFGLQQPIVP